MRTPWRYVADLVTRKTKADYDGRAIKAPDIIGLEYQPTADKSQQDIESNPTERGTETLDQPIKETAPALDIESKVGDTSGTETTAHEKGSHAASIGSDEPAESAHEASTVRSVDEEAGLPSVLPQGPNTGQPSKALTSDAPLSRPTADKVEPLPSHQKPLLVEIAETDAEIGALRYQLAQKLVLQNAQLRTLLDRFKSS